MSGEIDQSADLRALLEKATPGELRISAFEPISGGTARMIMGEDNFAIAYVGHRSEAENNALAELFVATVNALPTLLAAADRLAGMERARDSAIRLMSDYARLAGEATGKLEMSEAAGIVDGWRERAERAESSLIASHAKVAELTAEVERLVDDRHKFIHQRDEYRVRAEAAEARNKVLEADNAWMAKTLKVIARASQRSETMFGGKMSEVTQVFQHITRVSDQALRPQPSTEGEG